MPRAAFPGLPQKYEFLRQGAVDSLAPYASGLRQHPLQPVPGPSQGGSECVLGGARQLAFTKDLIDRRSLIWIDVTAREWKSGSRQDLAHRDEQVCTLHHTLQQQVRVAADLSPPDGFSLPVLHPGRGVHWHALHARALLACMHMRAQIILMKRLDHDRNIANSCCHPLAAGENLILSQSMDGMPE